MNEKDCDYKSMQELGRDFGVSSHCIGRILKRADLRTPQGRPSSTAFDGGYVQKRWATGRADIYFWVWHVEKTATILQREGLKRANSGIDPGEQ